MFYFLIFFVFLLSCFCCCYNVNVENYAFLIDELSFASISWTEPMFCSSIIDFI